jgi:hypothetical protein
VFMPVAYNRKNSTYGKGTLDEIWNETIKVKLEMLEKIYKILSEFTCGSKGILYKFNPLFLRILMKDFKFPPSLFSISRRDSLIIQSQYTFHQ